MAEALWTAQEMRQIGEAMVDLQERVQEWETTNELKIGDLMLTVESTGRGGKFLGLVSMPDKSDTILQFEVVDIVPNITIV